MSRLPDDLRDYRAPMGSFQIVARDFAGGILLALFALLLIFWPYTMVTQ